MLGKKKYTNRIGTYLPIPQPILVSIGDTASRIVSANLGSDIYSSSATTENISIKNKYLPIPILGTIPYCACAASVDWLV